MDGFLSLVLEYGVEIGVFAGIVAILEFAFKPIRVIFDQFAKPQEIRLDKESIAQIAPDRRTDGPKLTTAEFIRIRRELKEELLAELSEARETERAQLLARIAALEEQIAEPEKALEEERKRIKELEKLLERSCNQIGSDRINKAREALERGDYSIADDLFAEIEAARELEIKEAARAAFGRGEIAEAEIRWADAAKHYARAARLDESYEHLVNASSFALLAGLPEVSESFAKLLLKKADRLGEPKKNANACNILGMALRAQGRFNEAETLYEEALAIEKSVVGTMHPDYAEKLNSLAIAVADQGRFNEAEELYNEVLDIVKAAFGASHPKYSVALNNLAELLRHMNRLEEAEDLIGRVIQIDFETIGDKHPIYATHLNNQANVMWALGRLEEAERLYKKVLEIGNATIGRKHPLYAIVLSNLAEVLRSLGRLTEAETLLIEAVEIGTATIGCEHPDFAMCLNNLALVVEDQGRLEEAERLYKNAIEIAEAKLGPKHHRTKKICENYEDLLVQISKIG